jgi:hypothetical protein
MKSNRLTDNQKKKLALFVKSEVDRVGSVPAFWRNWAAANPDKAFSQEYFRVIHAGELPTVAQPRLIAEAGNYLTRYAHVIFGFPITWELEPGEVRAYLLEGKLPENRAADIEAMDCQGKIIQLRHLMKTSDAPEALIFLAEVSRRLAELVPGIGLPEVYAAATPEPEEVYRVCLDEESRALLNDALSEHGVTLAPGSLTNYISERGMDEALVLAALMGEPFDSTREARKQLATIVETFEEASKEEIDAFYAALKKDVAATGEQPGKPKNIACRSGGGG